MQTHVTTTTIRLQNSSITPKISLVLSFQNATLPLLLMPGNHSVLFCSRMSYKWKHTVCDLLMFFFFFGCTSKHEELPQPGIEPVPPAVEVQSLNHWTTREVPSMWSFGTGFFHSVCLWYPSKLFFISVVFFLIYFLIFGCIGSSLLHVGFL